ncbi:MAG: alpha-glucosidase C-terminal domain-containing protein [Rudaea sp.]
MADAIHTVAHWWRGAVIYQTTRLGTEWFRRFMRWRRQQAAQRLGDIRFLDAAEPLLMFSRSHQGESLLIAMNLGAGPITAAVPDDLRLRPIQCPGPLAGRLQQAELHPPAYAALYARISA